jgi:hypothetical protein
MKKVKINGVVYNVPKPKVKHQTGGRPTVHMTKTAGVPWHDFVYALFENNERSRDKLTDTELAHLIARECPKIQFVRSDYRRSPVTVTLKYRNLYNQGGLCRHLTPKLCSFRYDEEGFPTTNRGSSRLSPEDMRRTILKFQIGDPRLNQPAASLVKGGLVKNVDMIAKRLKDEREARFK